jgi:hypothetical protein
MKENLLLKLYKQENLKELYVNSVKKNEEKKKAERDFILEKTLKDKIDKDRRDDEITSIVKNRVNYV